MVEQLKGLGTPRRRAGYAEFIAAAEDSPRPRAKPSSPPSAATAPRWRQPSRSATRRSPRSSRRPSAYGFEDCGEGAERADCRIPAPAAPKRRSRRSRSTTKKSRRRSRRRNPKRREAAPEDRRRRRRGRRHRRRLPAAAAGGIGGGGTEAAASSRRHRSPARIASPHRPICAECSTRSPQAAEDSAQAP